MEKKVKQPKQTVVTVNASEPAFRQAAGASISTLGAQGAGGNVRIQAGQDIALAQVAPKVRKTKKPGRKPKARAERIRELSRAGFTPKQIRAKVGGTIEYVYVVRTAMRAADKKRKPVLPFAPAPVKREGTAVPYDSDTAEWKLIAMRTPLRPTLWQRIKAVFTG